MPYGDCSLSKKLDDGGHRPLNSATWTTSMAVVQARVLRFSRLRIRKGGMRNSRMSASCSDHDEAGGGNLPGSLDVFPAVPSKRLCGIPWLILFERAYLLPSRRFGGHDALSRENKKRRGKTVQALNRPFVFPRRNYRRSFSFRFARRKNRFLGVLKVPSLHEEAKRAHYAPGRCSSLKCSYLKCSALIRVYYMSVQTLCKLDVLSGIGLLTNSPLQENHLGNIAE